MQKASCLKWGLVLLVWTIASARALHAQTFVYSGREYQKAGRSYAQLRMMDLKTGVKTQLTTSPRDHEGAWCSPDARYILFTVPGEQWIYRFDRLSKLETQAIALSGEFFSIVGVLEGGRLLVQYRGSMLEIFDLKTNRSVRKFPGIGVSSPDGRLIAYEQGRSPFRESDNRRVHLADAGGGRDIDLGPGGTPAFFPDSKRLAFTRQSEDRLEVVVHDIAAGTSKTETVNGGFFHDFNDLTVAPDGKSMVVADDSGAYGSAGYYLLKDGAATDIDSNLHGWAGWTLGGVLVYATSRRTTRLLPGVGQVWVGDIKSFDLESGQVKDLVIGVSANYDPAWCPSTRPRSR